MDFDAGRNSDNHLSDGTAVQQRSRVHRTKTLSVLFTPHPALVSLTICLVTAQRFKHQIFLSLDLPSSIVSDSSGSNLLLVSLEKELVKQLTSILNR